MGKLLDALFSGPTLLPAQYWVDDGRQQMSTFENQPGLSTPWSSMNKLCRLYPTDLGIIAGRPSQGKTSLAVQMALFTAGQWRRDGDSRHVVFFSAEVDPAVLMLRVATGVADVSFDLLRQGKLNAAEKDGVEAALFDLSSLPLILARGGSSARDIVNKLDALNDTKPVGLVFADHLELFRSMNDVVSDKEDRTDRVGAIASSLKGVAKALHIPVVVLAQLNRECEARPDKQPALSDLRSSDLVGQVTDWAWGIVNPGWYLSQGINIRLDDPGDGSGTVLVSVLKNRFGGVGRVRLAWDGSRGLASDRVTVRVPLAPVEETSNGSGRRGTRASWSAGKN